MAATLHGFWGATKTVSVGSMDAAESNTLTLEFGQPVAVKRLIWVTTQAQTVADAKITIGTRDADGSSNSVSHSAYTLPNSGSALGDVQTMELAVPDTAADATGSDSLDVFSATPVLLEVTVDRQLFVTTDAGGDAGIYDVYVQVQELGFHLGAANTNTATALTREAV